MTGEDEQPVAEAGSYRLLAKGEAFRLGISSERSEERPVMMTLEAEVRLFRPGGRLSPGDLDRAAALVRALERRGYSVFFQEDGWIACERPGREVDSGSEARWLRELLGGR